MNIGTPVRKAMLALLLLAIVLTVAFIFSNSLRTPEESMEQSSAVGGFVAEIFPPDTPLGGFIAEHLRKIAHFLEYALLGVECALLVIFYLQKRRFYACLSVPAAFSVAAVDELLQNFSGRGPALGDVCIDLAGFVFASLFTYGAAYLVRVIIGIGCAKDNDMEKENG